MQPLSPVAARRPIVSGAGTRHRRWGCCSFGGVLALMAWIGAADAAPRDGVGRAARLPGRTAAVAVRAPRPADMRPDSLRPAHRLPGPRPASAHRAPEVRAATAPEVRAATAYRELEVRAATAYRAPAVRAATAPGGPDARAATGHHLPESRPALHRGPDIRAAAVHPSPPPDRVAPTERAEGRSPPSRTPREDAGVPAAEPVHLALRREPFGFAVPAEPSPGLPRDAFAGVHGADGLAPWKPARARWGFEHGRLAVQLDGGTRLSLRPRRGGLAISLKRSF